MSIAPDDDYFTAASKGQLAPTTRSASALAQASRDTGEVVFMIRAAHEFPRNIIQSRSDILNAFSRPKLAEQALYAYAKGGTEVTGPSIRSAEAIAQYWGNMSFGYRVLSEHVGVDGIVVSEVQAYAMDYESTLRREATFPVKHWRTTKKGGYKLTDDREVYELIANMAARRTRACILAVVPGDVTEEAMEQAETTLKSKADTGPEAMKKMCERFAEFAVTREHIEKFIQRSLDSISPAQVVRLRHVYTSLKDGMSRAAQWFEIEPEPSTASSLERLKATSAPPVSGAGAGADAQDKGDYDVADFIARISNAQTLEELQIMDDAVGALPDGPDKQLLVERLTHRDKQLASDDPDSPNRR
jgi:hypothetical protein